MEDSVIKLLYQKDLQGLKGFDTQMPHNYRKKTLTMDFEAVRI